MNKQIAFAIRILKSSHIPTFDGFTVIEQRSLQFVFPINRFASSVTDIRVFISQIIGMHIHDIFPGRRAFHHFHPLAYTVRTQYTIGLHRQHHSFKFPVNQIIGRVATESRKGITLIRFIFSEQIIPPTIFHNACTMCIDNIPLFVEPRYAVINYFSESCAEHAPRLNPIRTANRKVHFIVISFIKLKTYFYYFAMRVEREDKFISCILHRQFLLSLAYFYFRLSVFTHYHCQRLTKQLIIQCQTRCYLEGRLFLSNIQLYIFRSFT